MKAAVPVRAVCPSEAERFHYRWVALTASFLVRALVFGSLFSVGVLYVEWLNDFQTSRGQTAWIGSIATGSTLLMGPIGSALLERFSCRKVVTWSGVVMVIGLIVSSFANGVTYLCVSFGAVTGCASGVANLAAVVSINQYFDRQRPLAMGIGSGGVGVGTFVFGMLQKYFVKEYTWKGSLLLLGAIQLHVVVCGLLLIQPKQLKHMQVLWNWRSGKLNREQDKPHSDVIMALSDRDEQGSAESSHASVVNAMNSEQKVDSVKDRVKRRRSTFQTIRSKMRLTDKTISLITDPVFLFLFLSDFLSWCVQFVPYVHLPERAKMLGVNDGAELLSIMGVMNAVGKISFGAFCTFLKLPPLKVFIVAQFFFGLVTIVSPFCVSFWSLALFAASFGFLSGSYGLMMVIPGDLLGEERFALAYGMLLAAEGVGVFLGPPLVGWMSDASNSYDSSLFVAGSVLLLSSILLLVPLLIGSLKGRKSKVDIKRAW